jgi:peptidoglycan/xylan/chitin deacetylase (PgdA/CDA1 family)
MLRAAKLTTLTLLRRSGAFELIAGSSWRQQRLLILCYHGTSLEDEHVWRPSLYIDLKKLEYRMAALQFGGYRVLPLGEALGKLRSQTLPPRSVAITFDDGTYDFFRQAYPLLKRYGFPATVYLTTYYNVLERPVFNLICSYMLWQRRNEIFADGRELGLDGPFDLTTEVKRHKIVRSLIDLAQRENMSGMQKDDLASRLAEFLRVDYQALKEKRILQLMNDAEVREVARNGIDIQLHTHRHRTPEEEPLFRKEIEDNRSRIRELIGSEAVHFCYPSGVYRREMFSWLQKERVVSATTCDTGLATSHSQSLLLPRFIDSYSRTQLEFESWISGVGHFLALRRAASQKYLPATD